MEFCGVGFIIDFVKNIKGNIFKEDWIVYIFREILRGLVYFYIYYVIYWDIKG